MERLTKGRQALVLIDAPLARVVGGEDEGGGLELTSQLTRCLIPPRMFCSGSHGSVMPYAAAVVGMSCIAPRAPLEETRLRSKSAFLARDGDREAGVRAFLAGDPDDERLDGLGHRGEGLRHEGGISAAGLPTISGVAAVGRAIPSSPITTSRGAAGERCAFAIDGAETVGATLSTGLRGVAGLDTAPGGCADTVPVAPATTVAAATQPLRNLVLTTSPALFVGPRGLNHLASYFTKVKLKKERLTMQKWLARACGG